ncbi:MAG: DUF1800 family protein, partial [bacterium]
IYLDGDSNKDAQPNENFARELLELFTMGVGNYSEDDIKEAARSFSGWQNNSVTLQSFFNPNRHDNGIKNFLGRSGNFAGDDIIDIILEQPQTALFIARKLFKFFVSREIDEPFVNDLANLFRSSDYEIKPVLRMIFTSNFFYSDQAVGSLIKGPVEMAVNNARIFSVDSIDLGYVLNATSDLNQELLSPPNVAGWPGQRGWISPTTYVTRNTFSESYVDGGLYNNPDSNRSPIVFDPLKFARSFGLSGATDLAQAMVAHLVRLPISEETMSFLISVLVGSAAVDDWSLDYPGADRLVKEFLVQVTRLPEFHLT